MHMTLRDEILVVCDYENFTYGKEIKERVEALRNSAHITHLPTDSDMRALLRVMVEKDGLLEPWIGYKRGKKLWKYFLVGEFEDRDPLRLHFKLTPMGWRAQKKLLDEMMRIQGWPLK